MENRFGEMITLEKTFQNLKKYTRFWNGEERNFRGWMLIKDHGACRWDRRFAQNMIDAGADWEVLDSPDSRLNGQRPAPDELTEADFPLTVMYM